eukprot:TRINITY_DN67110_c9_g1_i1.p1 TRINITY_DN67110_c9_g1~~TRINITY_DN67110_c9_g1_i1.p1  ORF type:complete len:229 (-),score=45.74 TRINITY_DN67110_c9_g1_i1:164-850(-)
MQHSTTNTPPHPYEHKKHNKHKHQQYSDASPQAKSSSSSPSKSTQNKSTSHDAAAGADRLSTKDRADLIKQLPVAADSSFKAPTSNPPSPRTAADDNTSETDAFIKTQSKGSLQFKLHSSSLTNNTAAPGQRLNQHLTLAHASMSITAAKNKSLMMAMKANLRHCNELAEQSKRRMESMQKRVQRIHAVQQAREEEMEATRREQVKGQVPAVPCADTLEEEQLVSTYK